MRNENTENRDKFEGLDPRIPLELSLSSEEDPFQLLDKVVQIPDGVSVVYISNGDEKDLKYSLFGYGESAEDVEYEVLEFLDMLNEINEDQDKSSLERQIYADTFSFLNYRFIPGRSFITVYKYEDFLSIQMGINDGSASDGAEFKQEMIGGDRMRTFSAKVSNQKVTYYALAQSGKEELTISEPVIHRDRLFVKEVFREGFDQEKAEYEVIVQFSNNPLTIEQEALLFGENKRAEPRTIALMKPELKEHMRRVLAQWPSAYKKVSTPSPRFDKRTSHVDYDSGYPRIVSEGSIKTPTTHSILIDRKDAELATLHIEDKTGIPVESTIQSENIQTKMKIFEPTGEEYEILVFTGTVSINDGIETKTYSLVNQELPLTIEYMNKKPVRLASAIRVLLIELESRGELAALETG